MLQTIDSSQEEYTQMHQPEANKNLLFNAEEDSSERWVHRIHSKSYEQTIILPHVSENQDIVIDGRVKSDLKFDKPNEGFTSPPVSPNDRSSQYLDSSTDAKNLRKGTSDKNER